MLHFVERARSHSFALETSTEDRSKGLSHCKGCLTNCLWPGPIAWAQDLAVSQDHSITLCLTKPCSILVTHQNFISVRLLEISVLKMQHGHSVTKYLNFRDQRWKVPANPRSPEVLQRIRIKGGRNPEREKCRNLAWVVSLGHHKLSQSLRYSKHSSSKTHRLGFFCLKKKEE